jgi:ABC-type branched-subunit amino acid transport system permease subunit
MPNVPSLNVPFNPDSTLDPVGMFIFCMVLLMAVYFGLHGLLATRFGRVLVAIRENEQRVEFLGYDARLHKVVAFVIGGALAGLAGCLFTAWGNFVSPTAFGVVQSAQIIIWIMVGGAGTLLGPVIGAVAISWLTTEIGTQQVVNANVVLGAILLIFVLLVPKGVAPMVTERLVPRLMSLRRDVGMPNKLPQEGKA